MANDYYDLTELAKINDANVVDLGLSDILEDAPFLASLAAVPASNGTVHKWNKQTTSPTTGFRAVNDGRENDKAEDTTVTENLKILDASFAVDMALAGGYKGGADALIEREAKRALKSAFFSAESQLINGTGADSGGFNGLADLATIDALADAMVVDAGGTTATTASSLYAMRTGEDEVAVVIGNDGMIDMSEPIIQRIAGSATGFLPAYFVAISGWLSLQYGAAKSVGRIVNLTDDSGKGLTDDLVFELLKEFPATRLPNMLLTNRRSREQLRKSRTATNATGTPAPTPTEVGGIPLVITDAISEVEALIA